MNGERCRILVLVDDIDVPVVVAEPGASFWQMGVDKAGRVEGGVTI